MIVPVNEPVIPSQSKKYVLDCLKTGWISSAGKYISLFEEKFAGYLGVKEAVTTTSGTTALHLALLTLGIGEGDEVILPNFTMIATVYAVIYTGAKPIFVDVDPETYNIDPQKIEEKINSRTRAIMPVHIYGHPVDMDSVLKIAKKKGLYVIEDAAEAHGAEYRGKKCGSFGDINCFSFYGNKIITTGEGGMVVTNNKKLADKARRLKDLAHSPKKRFLHDELGYNYRITNLQAAVGLGQLDNIDKLLKKKAQMAGIYGRRLKNIPGLRLPVTKDYAKNVYWMYSVLVEKEFGMARDELREKLRELGIDTREFFVPCSDQPVVKALYEDSGQYQVSRHISRTGLYLPSGLAISQEQIKYVCDMVIKLSRGAQ